MAKYNPVLLIFAIYLTRIKFIYSQRCLEDGGLVPIILVPGLGGSRLEAQLSKPTVTHHYCSQNTYGFFTLWLDVKQLLPVVINCWVDNMKLNYDDLANMTFNQPGVKTRVPDFGNPEVVEYLDSESLGLIGGYLNHLASALLKLGYSRRKNLYAAPYDFRKGPSELNNFFNDLEQLVEKAYEFNNSSVILIAHSMGGQLTLKFLNNKSQEWKDKHIRAFISLSVPFGGTMKALKTFTVGDDLGIFLLRSEILKEVQSTMPSVAYLLPNKELWGDEVLVSTVAKNYTLEDLEEFFDDIGNPTGWKMYLNEKKFIDRLSPPGVETHCFYGEGIATIKRLIYTSNNFSGIPAMEYENGDGTANLRSLQYCKRWIIQQKERVETKSFDGVDHMSIIDDESVLNYIMRTIIELSAC